MSTITCTACGHANPTESSFCGRCGAALVAPATPAVPTAPPAPASGWDLASAGMHQPAAAWAPGLLREFPREAYASWGQRFGASILDGMFLLLFFAATWGGVALVSYLVAPDATESFFDAWGDDSFSSDQEWIPLIALLSWLPLPLLWDIFWVRSKGMGKPGQRVAGFRVATPQGARVGGGKATGRAFAKLLDVPLGGVLALAAAFTIGISKRRQAVHDMIAGTVCIKKRMLELRAADDPASYESQVAVWPTPSLPPAAPPAASPPDGPGQSGPFV